MGRISILLLLFTSTNVWAVAPKITAISGASNFVLTGTPIVWGGIAGGECGGATTTVCNSCTAAVADTDTDCLALGTSATKYLCRCNTTRIHNGGQLVITVKREAGATGNLVFDSTDDGIDEKTGGLDSVSVEWRDLCGGDCEASTETDVNGRLCFDSDANGNCDSGDSASFNIKIIKPPKEYDVWDDTAHADGIGQFTAFPGDEKIYIDDPESPSNFPELGYSSKIQKVRVYISTVNLKSANFGEGDLDPEDIDVTGTELANGKVDGLDNETPYAVRLGMVDEANNVTQFFPGPDPAVADCADATVAPDPPNCRYAATPDRVLGMLTEDFNCFIATAAYGSALEPKLNLFRKFRQHILLRHNWGVKLVKSYYKYGPFAARYIHDKPVFRFATQAVLWPLYGFSWLALKIGLVKAAAVASILISALLFLPWLGLGGRRGRG